MKGQTVKNFMLLKIHDKPKLVTGGPKVAWLQLVWRMSAVATRGDRAGVAPGGGKEAVGGWEAGRLVGQVPESVR